MSAKHGRDVNSKIKHAAAAFVVIWTGFMLHVSASAFNWLAIEPVYGAGEIISDYGLGVQCVLLAVGLAIYKKSKIWSFLVLVVPQFLMWQMVQTLCVGRLARGHTRMWINGEEVPTHISPSPEKPRVTSGSKNDRE